MDDGTGTETEVGGWTEAEAEAELVKNKRRYREILNLSLLSSFFNDVRLERFLPWRERWWLLLRWEQSLHIPKRTDQCEFACYFCFRIKKAECFQPSGSGVERHTCVVIKRNKFTGVRTFAVDPVTLSGCLPPADTEPLVPAPRWATWQPSAPGAVPGSVEALRRYCIPCGIQSGLIRCLDIFYTKTELNSKLWLCGCGRPWDIIKETCNTCGFQQFLNSRP